MLDNDLEKLLSRWTYSLKKGNKIIIKTLIWTLLPDILLGNNYWFSFKKFNILQ